MLNALMDISEAKAGTLKLGMKHVDVSAFIEEVVEIYCYIAEEKHIIIATNCSGDLHITADPGSMRQVLGNLLDNAVKYTPSGGRVNIEAFQQDRQIIITIKNTGIGIRQEDLPKIWNHLYRADEGRSQRGLGLGLSIIKSIVELHGRHVEVSSEFGAGATFTVYLTQSK